MNKIKTQRGFATLEIVLVAASLAILSTIALPNMARILDKVRLDYEMKHLYSDLNFAQDLSRSVSYNPTSIGGGSYTPEMIVLRLNYKLQKTEIHRTLDGKPDSIFNKHQLSDGISFEKTQDTLLAIEFENARIKKPGSKTITLVSKFGNNAYIKWDSVGRVRGTYTK